MPTGRRPIRSSGERSSTPRRFPDRFAAVHASAAAPTDGTISPLSLRNTRFTFMIGENDTAYGRRERCEKFNQEIQKLKQAKEEPITRPARDFDLD